MTIPCVRKINLLVVHCSASPNGADIGAADIDRWHHQRGFERMEGWRKSQNYALTSIGYHFVIRLAGQIETGRHVDEIGAHAGPIRYRDGRQVVVQPGFNQRSLGICLVGTDRFTPLQWASLKHLIATLRSQYPGSDTLGHRDLSPDLNHDGKIEPIEFVKLCPGFDVKKWMAYGEPEPEHVLIKAAA